MPSMQARWTCGSIPRDASTPCECCFADLCRKEMAALRPGTGADARRVSKTMRTKER
jgi:hypothetical protein